MSYCYLNSPQKIISRIGRVCKNDQGGARKMKHRWTSFFKARISCSASGDVPFYYDYLQSAVFLPREQLIYAVFTTGPLV